MGIQRALEFCGGAVAVYLAMVACATEPKRPSAEASAGTAGEFAASAGEPGRPMTAGGAPSASAGGQGGFSDGAGGELTAGGFAGLISDPTPDAGAQEAGAGPGPGTCECPDPPVVPEEVVWEEYEADCETTPETGTHRFAMVDLPGVSELRRARAVVVARGAAELHQRIGGIASIQPALITETGLAVTCSADTVGTTFYVPSR